MDVFLLEAVAAGNVDPAGIIKGVKILGLVSKNGRRYRPDALKAALPLYENCQVNIDHTAKAAAGRIRIGSAR